MRFTTIIKCYLMEISEEPSVTPLYIPLASRLVRALNIGTVIPVNVDMF